MGTQALGVGSGCLAILLGGCLGRTPMAAVTTATAWFAVRDSSCLPGGKPEAHLFVGVQRQRRDECLFQALSTSVAHIVVCDYYVVQVGEVIPPHKHRRDRRRALLTCPTGQLAAATGMWQCGAI